MGAKYVHLAWINNRIPLGVQIAFDAFSGSQSVSFLFKQLGFKTITNDFLNFNNQIGLALVENKEERLDKSDLDMLFSNTENSDYDLMEKK